jgi:hypothetical protein
VLRGEVRDYMRLTEVAAALGVSRCGRSATASASPAGWRCWPRWLVAGVSTFVRMEGRCLGSAVALRNQAARASSRGTSTGSALPTGCASCQTWAAAAAPSGVRPEATERSGLEVPVHSPYTHSNQLQHPLTPERRRARMEYRSTRAGVPASNSRGQSPAADEL